MSEENGKFAHCKCGAQVPLDEYEFWGECVVCRQKLPFKGRQTGDNKGSPGQTDRNYHGGMGYRGEW